MLGRVALVLGLGCLFSCSPETPEVESVLVAGSLDCSKIQKFIKKNMRSQYRAIRDEMAKENPVGDYYQFCDGCKDAPLLPKGDSTIRRRFLAAVPEIKESWGLIPGIPLINIAAPVKGLKLKKLDIPGEDDIKIAIDGECNVTIDFDVTGKLQFAPKLEVRLLGGLFIGNADLDTTFVFTTHYKITSDRIISVDSNGNPGFGYFFHEPISKLTTFQKESFTCKGDSNLLDGLRLLGIEQPADGLNTKICADATDNFAKKVDEMKGFFGQSYGNFISYHRQTIGCFFDGAKTNCENALAQPYFMIRSTFNTRYCLAPDKANTEIWGNQYTLMKSFACHADDQPAEGMLYLHRKDGKLTTLRTDFSHNPYCIGIPRRERNIDEAVWNKCELSPSLTDSKCSGEPGICMTLNQRGQFVSQTSESRADGYHHKSGNPSACLDIRAWGNSDSNVHQERLNFWDCHPLDSGQTDNQTFKKEERFRIGLLDSRDNKNCPGNDLVFDMSNSEEVSLACPDSNRNGRQLFRFYTDRSIRLKDYPGKCLSSKGSRDLPTLWMIDCAKAGAKGRNWYLGKNRVIAQIGVSRGGPPNYFVTETQRCVDRGSDDSLRLHPKCVANKDQRFFITPP